MKKYVFIGLLLLFLSVGGVVIYSNRAQAPAPENNTQERQTNSAEPVSFDKSQYSLTDPESIWVIVNKNRPIPLEYEPKDLTTPNVQRDPRDSAKEQQVRQEVATAVEALFKDANSQGIQLMFASGYRSSTLQKTYYDNYVKRDGQEAADRYSARPGTSEHQTGLSFDLSRTDRKCYLETCFADTPEGQWLKDNVHEYGLILRYPSGKEAITGYQYEPWHFRYVDKDLARQLYESGQTMEEFFGL